MVDWEADKVVVMEEVEEVEKEGEAVDYPEHNCDMFCLPNV
jgi:hypothetical protein